MFPFLVQLHDFDCFPRLSASCCRPPAPASNVGATSVSSTITLLNLRCSTNTSLPPPYDPLMARSVTLISSSYHSQKRFSVSVIIRFHHYCRVVGDSGLMVACDRWRHPPLTVSTRIVNQHDRRMVVTACAERSRDVMRHVHPAPPDRTSSK